MSASTPTSTAPSFADSIRDGALLATRVVAAAIVVAVPWATGATVPAGLVATVAVWVTTGTWFAMQARLGTRTVDVRTWLFVDVALNALALVWLDGHPAVLVVPFVHVVTVAGLFGVPVVVSVAAAHLGATGLGAVVLASRGLPLPDGLLAATQTALVAVAATTLVSLRLVRGLHQTHARHLERLADFAHECESARDVEAIVDALVDALTTGLGYRTGAVALGPAEARTGTSRSRLVAALDASQGPLFAELGPGNAVLVDLVAGDTSVGTVGLRWPGARIRESTVTATERFCAHAALAVHNVRLSDEVHRLARVDGLTGLANRRAFDERFAEEVARSGRTGAPLSLVVADIDHFKQVNDRHGHQAGDAVLAGVADVLRTQGRISDLPCRFGGEEFTILLPETDGHGAYHFAERLRHAIADAPLEVAVTVSLGVAVWSPADSQDDVFAAADRALYDAKEGGRNQTRCAAGVPRRRITPLRASRPEPAEILTPVT